MHKLITLLLFLILAPLATAEVYPVWSTGVAVPGEQVVLYLIDTEVGSDPFILKETPRARFASIQAQQPAVDVNPLDPNRAMVEILPIFVRADKAGTLQLEDLVVEYRSGRKHTLPVPPLPVLSTAEIKWYSTPVNYGALWYTQPTEGYVHQPVRAALKIFLPQDCSMGALPQLQSIGVKVNTMQQAAQGVVALVHSRLMSNPVAFARGQNWNTIDLTGEFTPFREGKSDLVGKFLLTRRHGFFVVGQEEAYVPTLTLSALPLPPGAPAHFADTVGNYSVSTRTAATSLAMNEAVEVEITVRGTGNLQQLPCPLPSEADSWKLVPATRKPIISPSGDTVGMIFSQLMRPVTEVSSIPSFSMSYFDPAAMAYKRAASTPIPLPWRETDDSGGVIVQAATPPPAGQIPVAEMTDIYGYAPMEASLLLPYRELPRWLWYLLYLPAAGIMLFILGRVLLRRLAKHAGTRALERELAAISREQQGLAFLKRIGAFIESHIPAADMTPELESILRQRDNEAFRPEAAPVVPANQRTAMLKCVRKALVKTLLLLLALLPLATAAGDPAEEYYNARQYTKAQELLQEHIRSIAQPHPAAYYNLGNCAYRLGKPGRAALYYARALQLDPSYAEARANLSFIQRKEGAILPTRHGVAGIFTLLNCSQLWVATIVCTALLLFCISLRLLLRKHRAGAWVTAGIILFTCLSLLCGTNWLYYTTRETPDLSSLPPSDLAYILQSTTARSAAGSDAGSIIQLPASTPVHLLARRGSHAYVETTTGIRGWVPAKDVEALCPEGTPRLPVILRFR